MSTILAALRPITVIERISVRWECRGGVAWIVRQARAVGSISIIMDLAWIGRPCVGNMVGKTRAMKKEKPPLVLDIVRCVTGNTSRVWSKKLKRTDIDYRVIS